MDQIAIHLAAYSTNNEGSTSVAIAAPLVLTQKSPDELMAEHDPLMRLQPEEAQVLMDELWQCGIRPTEGTGSAGQLAATQKHLEDMRALALRDLKK